MTDVDDQMKSMEAQKALHHVVWPNLFDEAFEFLRMSILMYGITDVRQLARDGELPPEMTRVMLTMPVNVLESNKTIAQYLPLIEEKIIQKDEALYHLYFSCSKLMFTKGADKTTTYESVETNDELLIHFSDENSEKELVYAIAINRYETTFCKPNTLRLFCAATFLFSPRLSRTMKRIEIGFRGSVTTQDWVTDVKYALVELQDPGDKDNVVLVHQGFKEYLYGKPHRKHHVCKFTCKSSSEKEAHASKVEVITNQVLEALDEYPGYMIYTTGHSLGGALCTLLAFDLAGNDDERIPKPISCISFASPKVGNRKFANAFQVNERVDDKRRCIFMVQDTELTLTAAYHIYSRRWRRRLSCVVCGYGTSVTLSLSFRKPEY
jgi:hypothetical protein